MASDVLALCAQLWIRNRPLVEKLAERAVTQLQQDAANRKREKQAQRAEAEAVRNGATAPTPTEVPQ